MRYFGVNFVSSRQQNRFRRVILQLMKSKCSPALLYGLEAWI